VVAGVACLGATVASAAPFMVGDHYEENLRRSNCTNNSTAVCGLPMTSVPTGKKLLVTSVSCSVTYTGIPNFRSFNLTHQVGNLTSPGDPPFTYLVPVPQPFAGNPATRFYVVNQQTSQLFTAGQRPMIFQSITSATFSTFDCTIFGTMMPAVS
jgi:hypothetical protein